VRRAITLLLVSALLAAPVILARGASAGPTAGSGTLTGNTTWTQPGSPYLVAGHVSVPIGVTLTVDPGVQVRFDTTPPASHSIVVQGSIVSVGRPDLKVTYTSDDPFPDRNDWVSILLDGSAGSVIEWSEFSWGSTTIDIRQCSPRIANNTILESGLRAIQILGPNARPVIENNVLKTQLFNQRTGILLQDADPIIRNNNLTDNYFGIYVYLGGQPRIENNTIRNGWRGVLVVSANPLLANNTIEGNGLPNLGGVGVLLFDSSAILRDNVIRNNGVGVDIPYNSKQTLGFSRGNLVNGVPLETLYHYRTRDIKIVDPDIDSGHASGFVGNATEQGLLTFYDSVNATVTGAQLRNNRALVYAANSSVTVVNSTLSASDNDFLLTSVSPVVSLNTSFRIGAVNITDQRSSLTITNFLQVRTLSDTSTPIPDARVRVLQNGAELVRTITDREGWSRWTVASYGILSRVEGTVGPPDLTLSNVQVFVDHPAFAFRGSPRVVNMSSTHVETFFQTDNTRPRVMDTIPAANSVGVPFGSRVTISFSEPMNRTATEAAITVFGYHVGSFEWTPDGRAVSFAITDAQYGAPYFVRVDDTATDLAGNRLGSAYVFTFDIEHAARRVDLTPVWIGSLVVLAVGLALVGWRSRSRAKALRQEDGDR